MPFSKTQVVIARVALKLNKVKSFQWWNAKDISTIIINLRASRNTFMMQKSAIDYRSFDIKLQRISICKHNVDPTFVYIRKVPYFLEWQSIIGICFSLRIEIITLNCSCDEICIQPIKTYKNGIWNHSILASSLPHKSTHRDPVEIPQLSGRRTVFNSN